MDAMTTDPYAALGLTRTATDAEIKKAYRKIARDSHPDLNPDDPKAEERFKAAAAAYDLLKDPETRGRFDRGEIDATGAERAERPFYRDYSGQAGNPYGSRRTYRAGPEAEAGFEGEEDFADFFRRAGGFGGFAGRQGAEMRMQGADLRYALEVPFLDAARGSTRRITLPEGGTLDVRIPPGTADGQTLRLRGKGGPGYNGGAPGDALITLSVLPHPTFRRDGDDIVLTLPITLDEAVLGASVEAPTIDGPVKLKVPKGASSGQSLRLRGRGVQGRSGKKGDQRVELRIVLPKQIDKDLSEFMETWARTHAYDPRKGMPK